MTTSRSITALGAAQASPRSLGEARLTLLRERGVSLSEIARDVGKSLPSVSRVNRGTRRARAIEREIARRLGLAVPDVFPEWHSDDVAEDDDRSARHLHNFASTASVVG